MNAKAKFIISLTIVIIITSYFVGCNMTKKLKNKIKKPLEIDLWCIAASSDPFHQAYEKVINRINKKNRKIKIMMQTFSNEDYKMIIKKTVASNDLPDIFFTWGGNFSKPFIKSGKVRQLNDSDEINEELPQIYKKKFTTNIANENIFEITDDHKIFGYKYNTVFTCLFYNKAILQTFNLKKPKLFSELIEICKVLTAKKSSTNDFSPIAVSIPERWSLAMIFDAIVLKSMELENVTNALENYQNGEKKLENMPEFNLAIKKFNELIVNKAFSEDALECTYDEATKKFLDGEAAMLITGNWFSQTLKKEEKIRNKIWVTRFPLIEENDSPNKYIGGQNDTLMVSKSTKYQKEATKAVFDIAINLAQESYANGVGLKIDSDDYVKTSNNHITKVLTKIIEHDNNKYIPNFDLFLNGEATKKYLNDLQISYLKEGEKYRTKNQEKRQNKNELSEY